MVGWLNLNCCVVFAILSQQIQSILSYRIIDNIASLPPSALSKSVSVYVCQTFAGSSSESDAMRMTQKLFAENFTSSVVGPESDLLIFPHQSPVSLAKSVPSAVSLAIGYLHAFQVNAEQSEILSSITAFVETHLKAGKTPRVFIIAYGGGVKGEDVDATIGMERTKEQVIKLVDLACRSANKQISDIDLSISFIDGSTESFLTARKGLEEMLSKSTPAKLDASIFNRIVSNRPISSSQSIGSSICSSAESRASVEVNSIVESFLAEVDRRMDELISGIIAGSPIGVAEVSAALDLASGALTIQEFPSVASEGRLVTSGLSGAPVTLRKAAMRVRYGIILAFAKVFRQMANTALTNSIASFTAGTKKIGPGAKLKSNLQNLQSKCEVDFKSKLSSLRKELLSVFQSKSRELISGLPSSEEGSTLSALRAALGAAGEERRLRSVLSESLHERIKFLFLQGSHNPFIRTYPFPPLHVNLNYLIDPRGVGFELDYKKYYDEHYDGAAEKRADPLLIPGVANIPFNPNKLSDAKGDERSWIQIIREFFSDDLED